jgi:release factor glutamine methyltransferase
LTASTTVQALVSAHTLGLDRLDAQLLLLHALGKSDTDRAWLLAHDGDALSVSVAHVFNVLCLRRAAGEPLAYIVGCKEFFGLRFAVDARVLIPRPDTETLVQWALDVVQDIPEPDVLDLGTGSGAVAVAIAHTCKAKVTAIDFSLEALTVAAENAKRLGVDVQFGQSNWFEKVSGHYYLIVSNPPYIADADSHLAALTHEPLGALTAGKDGLDDLRQIIEHAPSYLKPGGWLLLEHGYDQANSVCGLLTKRGFAQVRSRTDLAGIARCSGGQWQRPNSGIIID